MSLIPVLSGSDASTNGQPWYNFKPWTVWLITNCTEMNRYNPEKVLSRITIELNLKIIKYIVKNLRKQKNCKVSKPELSADKKVKYTFCQTPEKVFIEIVEVLKK